MPGCAIITCRQRSGTGNGVPSNNNRGRVSFHRFPIEPNLKEKWINATGRGKKWSPTKLSTICSNHFSDNDFVIKKSGYRYLHLGAIPHENVVTVHSFTPSTTSHFNGIEKQKQGLEIDTTAANQDNEQESVFFKTEISEEYTTSTDHENIKANVVLKVEATGECNTSTDYGNRYIQDANFLKPNTGGPRQSITHDQNIIKRQRLQIKKVQAQNRRLRKRLSKVEGMFAALKEKLDMREDDSCALQNENESVRDLLTRCICKKTRLPFSSALRTFAFNLYSHSPEAYNYVRNSLDAGLPHTRTLRKWYPNMKKGVEEPFVEESLLDENSFDDPLKEPSEDPLEQSSGNLFVESSESSLVETVEKDLNVVPDKLLEEIQGNSLEGGREKEEEVIKNP